jgi:hypothetical protein
MSYVITGYVIGLSLVLCASVMEIMNACKFILNGDEGVESFSRLLVNVMYKIDAPNCPLNPTQSTL